MARYTRREVQCPRCKTSPILWYKGPRLLTFAETTTFEGEPETYFTDDAQMPLKQVSGFYKCDACKSEWDGRADIVKEWTESGKPLGRMVSSW